MRQWIEAEWLPYALSIGVDMGSFWHLTPHTLSLIAEGYNIALKRQYENQNAMAYLQGAYFVEALTATVGNMFSGKGSKKHKYPEKPYDLNIDGKKAEREQESQLQLFSANLTTMMNNFNLSKEKG